MALEDRGKVTPMVN